MKIKTPTIKDLAAANPGGVARIEDQFRDPAENPARIESRARKLYALRLIDPRAPQYALADSLMDRARALRLAAAAEPTN